MMKGMFLLTSALSILLSAGCNPTAEVCDGPGFQARAAATLDSLYKHYSAGERHLMRENYPSEVQQQVTYLNETAAKPGNEYAFLWPYSGVVSAVGALYEATGDTAYKSLLDKRVLPGLEAYFDTARAPSGYASYINSAAPSDRYYDDNIWIGIDFTDLYAATGKREYLEKALTVWQFVESGADTQLGGGIYWMEQQRTTKNSCSNAPAAVFALKLYSATEQDDFLEKGSALYAWTKKNLQDPDDGLYYDHLKLDGEVDRAKYSYNNGQMRQAAAILHAVTGENEYLADAQQLAGSCHRKWFTEYNGNETSFRLLDDRNTWFAAVMLRGFIELYEQDRNPIYLRDFGRSLDLAWAQARDERGLFSRDWRGAEQDATKWLLTQAAMVEMYARMSQINN